MTTFVRRATLPVVTAMMALLVAGASFTASPAAASSTARAADPTLPISWNVNASTHLKSLNLDVVVPPGTFNGSIDLVTGALTGNLVLPPASKTISLFGLPLASTTFAMSENGPITGHVDLSTFQVTVNASFNFAISSASLSVLPWLNLVGRNCKGTSPIGVTMSGPVSLTGASTFTSTYTLPKLGGCGLLTPILNLIVPGPGNTFTATFAPPAP